MLWGPSTSSVLLRVSEPWNSVFSMVSGMAGEVSIMEKDTVVVSMEYEGTEMWTTAVGGEGSMV